MMEYDYNLQEVDSTVTSRYSTGLFTTINPYEGGHQDTNRWGPTVGDEA